jgi:hypothetical protein
VFSARVDLVEESPHMTVDLVGHLSCAKWPAPVIDTNRPCGAYRRVCSTGAQHVRVGLTAHVQNGHAKGRAIERMNRCPSRRS